MLSVPAVSTAQQEAYSQLDVRGTVEAVDHSARTVTIRLQSGTAVTLDVPANAERFQQVRVGDIVQATYYDRISVRLKPWASSSAVVTRPCASSSLASIWKLSKSRTLMVPSCTSASRSASSRAWALSFTSA